MADQDISLLNRGKTLEDAFFLQQDMKLIEELKNLRKMKETKENLAKVSGIQSDFVLQKLVELNVKPETLATISVIPLVAVAWADGEVDAKEKEAVLAGAEKAGFAEDSVDHTLLEQWLTHRPEPKLLAAWAHYVNGLCEQLEEKERNALKKEVMAHAVMVAKASGSFLGLTSGISTEEEAVLKKLESAFRR